MLGRFCRHPTHAVSNLRATIHLEFREIDVKPLLIQLPHCMFYRVKKQIHLLSLQFFALGYEAIFPAKLVFNVSDYHSYLPSELKQSNACVNAVTLPHRKRPSFC